MNESTAPICFPDGIPDEVYFRELRTLKQSYTPKQVKGIEARKDLVLMCAAARYPISMIAAKAHLDDRLVSLLISRESEEIALNSRVLSKSLKICGDQLLNLVATKLDGATFKDLLSASSLLYDRARELEVVAAMG